MRYSQNSLKDQISRLAIRVSAVISPHLAEVSSVYAEGADKLNSYGLEADDIVLIEISGGFFEGGEPFLGKLYALVPLAYLQKGEEPCINELTTFCAINIMDAKPDKNEDVLRYLQSFSNNYFELDPKYKSPVDWSTLLSFNPKKSAHRAFLKGGYCDVLTALIGKSVEKRDISALFELAAKDRDKDGVLAANGACSSANYEIFGYFGRDCFDERGEIVSYLPSDKDGDFVPDDVERYVGMDSAKWDENGNGAADGIDWTYDPYYKHQWHLRSSGLITNNGNNVKTIVGVDLDILELQREYMGYGGGDFVTVQVVDTGVEASHEDLAANIDPSLSLNLVTESNDPTPVRTPDDTVEELSPMGIGHGTACAGIIAARGFNKKGVRGVAPFAKIAGCNLLENQSYANLERVFMIDDSGVKNKIVVSNHSWNYTSGNANMFDYTGMNSIYNEVSKLRDKKGRVVVISAGNYREKGRDANLDRLIAHHYPIAVAALDYNNSYAPYSNPGANLWLSGYSGSNLFSTPTIATTMLSGKAKRVTVDELAPFSAYTFFDDTSRSYTFGMNGTSSAAPTVSGSLALVLEACPHLGYRDVKYLSALSAKKVDPKNSSWRTNAAGISHSRDYGFGLVNPQKMIKECKGGYALLSPNKSVDKSVAVNLADRESVLIDFDINDNISIEFVSLSVKMDMEDYGNLQIALTSPSGTTIPVIERIKGDLDMDFSVEAVFGIAGFLDESSIGRWRLSIASREALDLFDIDGASIKIDGR